MKKRGDETRRPKKDNEREERRKETALEESPGF
jgi:hypothetical protein